jgi:hypothetical protein
MYRSVSSTVVTVCAFNPSCFLRNVSMSTSITSSPGLSTTAALKELDGSGIQVAQSALQLLYLKVLQLQLHFRDTNRFSRLGEYRSAYNRRKFRIRRETDVVGHVNGTFGGFGGIRHRTSLSG